MLALEEYEQTQARLEELSGKLATLEAERTELLLRVENFTSLRLRSFKEAFDAVNENFQGNFCNSFRRRWLFAARRCGRSV